MKRKDSENSICVGQRGFTLIELLVVMVIIGMLASLVGPRVFKRLEKAKQQGADGQRHLFDMALDTYRLDVGHYPRSLDGLINNDNEPGWDGPYLKKQEIPKDPWGGDWSYQINSDDDSYTLTHSKSSETNQGEGSLSNGRVVPLGDSRLGIDVRSNAFYA